MVQDLSQALAACKYLELKTAAMPDWQQHCDMQESSRDKPVVTSAQHPV